MTCAVAACMRLIKQEAFRVRQARLSRNEQGCSLRSAVHEYPLALPYRFASLHGLLATCV